MPEKRKVGRPAKKNKKTKRLVTLIDPIEDADIVALLIKEKNRGENISNIVRRALRFYAHQEFLNQHEYFVERQANLKNNMIAKDTSGYSNIDTSEQEHKSTNEFVAKNTSSVNNKPKPKITKIQAENNDDNVLDILNQGFKPL
ncbi:hypothetical protein [Ligilactobacillus salivarius]|uniref:hypothetical protein n=1 Tax=Ligilactobacillus salivarius TaxID=1624 RepID=UPI0009DA4770|nr:hypothetical protein [Ligilactobacillus salivarius]OQR18832.1 hypothetical protein B6U39_09505 [Ligilactobacillus salivarius]